MSEAERKPEFYARDSSGEWVRIGENIDFTPAITQAKAAAARLNEALGKFAKLTTTRWAATMAKLSATFEQLKRILAPEENDRQAHRKRRRLAKRLNRKRRMEKVKKTWRTQARLFQRYGEGITIYYRILREEERRKKPEHPRWEIAQAAPTDCVGLVKGFFWGAAPEETEAKGEHE